MNTDKNNFNISKLSDHIFWDVDKDTLDAQKNKRLIIQRVLDYGLLNDWNMIKNYYGVNEIAQTATTLRELDPRSLSFISQISKIAPENFLCYTTIRSQPKHWNF